ncbi:MAG: hypothetical protein HW385_844 [candidate division NC10 bacterium]|jgi:hypothetical protein|nr:hypothetical protein [candidate division NC10 bacterium]
MLPPPGPRVPEDLMRPERQASRRRPQKLCIISPYTVATGIFYLCEDLGGDHYI